MALSANHNTFFTRHRLLIWAAGIVAAVVVLASFMSRGDVVPVRTATVERGTIRSVVSTNGKVEPLQSFEAHAPVGTTVKRLLVREGDRVKRGQLLAQLDDADASSQAARALAQVRAAQAAMSAVQSGGNREEVLTLESQLVKARTQRDTSQRNVDAQKSEAQSAYAAAENILRQLNIRAPFDGIVYSLPVHQGSYVNPGDLVLQEADLSKVLVRAFVDEPDVG